MLVRLRMLGSIALAATSTLACAPSDDSSWEIVHEESDGALLGIWGSGPDDLWAVGGTAGRGVVLHNDGAGWTTVHTTPELLTWTYGFKADDVYAVGEFGQLIHYDGTGWQQIDTGTTKTLYGLWGRSGGDVWVVGGVAAGGDGEAVVLRGNGTTFAAVDDIPEELVPSAFYKPYGVHDEVLIVGASGTILRYDGSTWTRDAVPTDGPIFSMWGRDGELFAVGGQSQGELLHYDGSDWRRLADDLHLSLTGVFAEPNGTTTAVGEQGLIVEIDPDGMDTQSATNGSYLPSLHSVWGDGVSLYSVGGDLWAYPRMTSGLILRR